jgi:hypothetical protein
MAAGSGHGPKLEKPASAASAAKSGCKKIRGVNVCRAKMLIKSDNITPDPGELSANKAAVCSRHCTAKAAGASCRACLPVPALSLLSSPRPHWRTPTIPPVSSNARRSTIRQRLLRAGGIIPPGKRKTRPESAPAAAATIIASGAIRGRNHAEPCGNEDYLVRKCFYVEP